MQIFPEILHVFINKQLSPIHRYEQLIIYFGYVKRPHYRNVDLVTSKKYITFIASKKFQSQGNWFIPRLWLDANVSSKDWWRQIVMYCSKFVRVTIENLEMPIHL